MVAKIMYNYSLFGTLNYNFKKVNADEAKVIFENKTFESLDGSFSMNRALASFQPYLDVNKRTVKPIFHVSLNPSPNDILSDNQLIQIAKDYMNGMNYGEQPYIVFKHTDISRTHLHIVSVNVLENGQRINRSFDRPKSMDICRKIEKDYGLEVPKNTEEDLPLKKIAYKEGNVRNQVANIVKNLSKDYTYQSLGEYRALLGLYNVTAEEVKGEHNGKPYNGMLYFVTDEKGNKIGTPFKASSITKDVGYPAIQKHYIKSKKTIQDNKIQTILNPIISKAIRDSTNKEEFISNLKSNNIDVLIRTNDTGRIYGVTFIDHVNQAVMNGSRISKEFSANYINDLFNSNPLKIKSENTTHNETNNHFTLHNENVAVSDLIGVLGTLEVHGDNYEDELFKRKMRKMKRRKR